MARHSKCHFLYHAPSPCLHEKLLAELQNVLTPQHSIRSRFNSAKKVGLEVKVRCARLLMSSLVQPREMRTSSHKAPPPIISFAFTSDII